MKKLFATMFITAIIFSSLILESNSEVKPDIEIFDTSSSVILACAVSNNEKYLATASDTIKIIEIATQKVIYQMLNSNKNITGIAVSDDGSKIIWGDKESKIIVWDVKNNKELANYYGYTMIPDIYHIYSIVISNDNSFFVTGEASGYIQGWDMLTYKEIFRKQYAFPLNIEVSDNNKYILVTGFDDSIWFDRL